MKWEGDGSFSARSYTHCHKNQWKTEATLPQKSMDDGSFSERSYTATKINGRRKLHCHKNQWKRETEVIVSGATLSQKSAETEVLVKGATLPQKSMEDRSFSVKRYTVTKIGERRKFKCKERHCHKKSLGD
jgi:hypothetical protein